MPEFTQIKETCLYVADLQRTQDFYEGKLGLKMFSKREESHVFFRAGSSVLLCFLPEVSREKTSLPGHYGSGKLHLAFECTHEQYQEWKDLVSSAGIEITHEQKWGKDHLSFYFEDPDGHVLEIVEAGMWD